MDGTCREVYSALHTKHPVPCLADTQHSTDFNGTKERR